MRKTILFWIAGAMVLASGSAANAQTSAPTGNVGSGPRSQDVAASNRQVDNDFNTLAGRGVEVSNMDRKGAKRHSAVPATAADIKSGAQVRDVKGVPIGAIAALGANEITADSDQIVIDTGHGKIGVPLVAFGKDDKGLLLSITTEKFNELMTQASSQASAAPAK